MAHRRATLGFDMNSNVSSAYKATLPSLDPIIIPVYTGSVRRANRQRFNSKGKKGRRGGIPELCFCVVENMVSVPLTKIVALFIYIKDRYPFYRFFSQNPKHLSIWERKHHSIESYAASKDAKAQFLLPLLQISVTTWAPLHMNYI